MTDTSGPAGIVWLASYPKSGNTWLRAFLTNYLHDAPTPADINNLVGRPMAASRSLFERYAAVSAADLTVDEIDLYRPAIYRAMRAEAAGIVPIKVHDAYRCNTAAEPLFPADATHAAIYIIRDARDVALSMSHHWDQSVDAAIDKLCRTDAVFAPAKGGSFAQVPQVVGSWSQHVSSWMGAVDINPLIVRFEDMIAEPRVQFRRVLEAIGLNVESARLDKAIAFSQLDQLQQQEDAHGFAERRGDARFFRSGRTEQWRAALSQPQAARIEHAHGEMLARWGYAVGA